MERQSSEATSAIAPEIRSGSLQEETLLAFTAIFAVHGPCSRRLALCMNAGQVGSAATLAVTALGGACLVVDSDAVRLRTAGRIGATDFTVTELSEALRILKNELRKGTPVGVGLLNDVQIAIDEMLRRGVQPDLVCATAAEATALQPFLRYGAEFVSLPARGPEQMAGLQIASDIAESMVERQRSDQRLKDQVQEVTALDGDGSKPGLLQAVQSRWLTIAPRLFRGDRSRAYWQLETGE